MCLMDAKKVKPSSLDAISSIPDDILVEILCLLPTKRAASTLILSKRWRNLFPLMTHLLASQHHFDLDDSYLLCPEEEEEGKRKRINYDHKRHFIDFVEKTLSGSSPITKLSLKCRDDPFSFALLNHWIGKSVERGVMDLDLRLKLRLARNDRHLPCNVLTNTTLVKLTLGIELSHFEINLKHQRVFLPKLKSLALHVPWFIGKEICDKMLSGCPVLEELSIFIQPSWTYIYRRETEDKRFSIYHKSLKRLTIVLVPYAENLDQRDCFIGLNTPSLVYLDYSGLVPLRKVTAKLSKSLIEAKLNVEYDGSSSKKLFSIINWVCNVETLSLSSASTKLMYSFGKELPLFSNLVKLSFESDAKEGWEVLPRILEKSPMLETLVLKGLHCIGKERVSINKNEVKVLEMYGFRGSGTEIKQVKCFLRKMQFLQVMKVELDVDVNDDNKKLQLMNDLLALPKRSSHCPIKFL